MDKTCDERYSPSWLAEGAREVMDRIDLDPASCQAANEIIRASRIFARETDGLARHWHGNVFLNPPFSDGIRYWVEKLARETKAGRVRQAVVVLPADMLNAITTAWFKTLLRGSMLVPHERIRFGGPEGVGTGPSFGTVVHYVGKCQLRFARVFGGRGIILRQIPVLPESCSEQSGADRRELRPISAAPKDPLESFGADFVVSDSSGGGQALPPRN